MGKFSLIFIKHQIPEILKLGTEVDPVWVEKARRIPGKNTAQGEVSGGTVIFNLSDLHDKEWILKTWSRKEVFSLKISEFSPLLPQILTPAENLYGKLFFGLRTNFGVDWSYHFTLPSTGVQDENKRNFQDMIQLKTRIWRPEFQDRKGFHFGWHQEKLVTNINHGIDKLFKLRGALCSQLAFENWFKKYCHFPVIKYASLDDSNKIWSGQVFCWNCNWIFFQPSAGFNPSYKCDRTISGIRFIVCAGQHFRYKFVYF